MNHLTPEQRAAVFEAAQDLSERTGLGLERCMVHVQQSVAAAAAWEEAMERIRALLQPLVDVFLERINALIADFQDLWDHSEAILQQPQCPSHRIALRGGRCARCERALYRKGHGFR